MPMGSVQVVARLNIKKGETVVIYIAGRPKFLRIDKVSREGIHFVDVDTGEEKYYRHRNIRKLYSRGDFKTLEFFDASDAVSQELARKCSASFSARPQPVQDSGVRNQWAMQELQRLEGKLGSVNADAISMLQDAVREKFGTIEGLSRPQIFKKRKLWLASGCKIESVTPDFANRGNTDAKVDERVDELAFKVIKNHFATRTRPQYSSAYFELIRLINEENEARDVEDRLTIPSIGYLKRRIHEVDPYHLTAAREGDDVARRKHGGFGPGERPTRPLEVLQIDHTPLDIVAIDDDFRVVIGRVYLTLAIDVFTRCIVGISIDYEKPSYHSVAKCLANAISFKDAIIERYGLVNDWPCYGIPQRILVDNGSEFHSAALEALCAALNIAIEYTRKRKSHLKGVVERTFRTINKDHFQAIPGSTFSNYLQLKGYDPKKFSLARVSSIVEAMYILIVDVLHQKGSRATLKKPPAMWAQHIDEFPPRMPASQSELDVILGREVLKPVHHYGVEINFLKYGGNNLPLIRNHSKFAPGKKYRTKINPDDVTKLHVLSEDGEWVALEIGDEERQLLAGFSVAHWTALRKFTRFEFRKSINLVGIANALKRFRDVLTKSIKRLGKQLSRALMKNLATGKAIAGQDNTDTNFLSERPRSPQKRSPEPIDTTEGDNDLDLGGYADLEVEIDG
jgi:transposase InsO family protein